MPFLSEVKRESKYSSEASFLCLEKYVWSYDHHHPPILLVSAALGTIEARVEFAENVKDCVDGWPQLTQLKSVFALFSNYPLPWHSWWCCSSRCVSNTVSHRQPTLILFLQSTRILKLESYRGVHDTPCHRTMRSKAEHILDSKRKMLGSSKPDPKLTSMIITSFKFRPSLDRSFTNTPL